MLGVPAVYAELPGEIRDAAATSLSGQGSATTTAP